MSKWKPQPWGVGDMAITLGPALLVMGVAFVRWTGIAGWMPPQPGTVGVLESLGVAIVVSMSVLGVVDTLRVNGGRVGWAWSVGNGGYMKALNSYVLYGLGLLYAGSAGVGAAQCGYLQYGSIAVMVLGGVLVLFPVIIFLAAWIVESRPTSATPLYEPRNKSPACKQPSSGRVPCGRGSPHQPLH